MLDDAMLSALNDETLAGDYNEAVPSGATECAHLDTVTEGDEEYCVFEDFESSLHAPVIITNRVLLTNDVLKWCRKGDEKYAGFFLRRVEQLAT